MLLIKASLIIATTFILVNPNGATSFGKKNVKCEETRLAVNVSRQDAPASPEPRNNTAPADNDMKVLAEGSHSEVTNPFLVVARDAQVYANLRKRVAGLPELQEDFFNHQAVIAAFLGERNSGGYSVQITRAGNGAIRVAASSPPKDAMVTQVITTPFKVVSVPTNLSLALEAEGGWQQAMRSYRITSGQFTMSGGFAGRMEQYGLQGDIRVTREGKLATFLFDVKTSGEEKQRSLKEAATGLVEDGSIVVSRIGAGSLIEIPHSDLSASGAFTDRHNKLALAFTSLPTMIADGYGGGGSVQAEATTPAPQKKQLVGSNPI